MSARATSTISTVLVDDEALALNELSFLINDFPDIEVTGTAQNGLEAVQLIEKTEPDLVFLDVQMPGLDGLGVIRKLQELEIPLPYFVFSTAYDQYAVEAFRLEAMDYLLKPIEKARLGQTIERARRVIEERWKAIEPSVLTTPAAPRTTPIRSKI
jgi:two-component system, LytTR family, response regulator LytT